MNAFLRFGFVFAIFSTFARSADTSVQVAASRGLRLAVYDSAKASPTRDAIHQTFAAALSEAISQRYGNPVGVQAKCVGADHAAFNLEAGVYDAVLVVGGSLPRPLAGSGVSRLTAVTGSGKNEKKIFLIFRPDDPTLVDLLTNAYPTAVNAPKFVQAMESATNPQVVARRD